MVKIQSTHTFFREYAREDATLSNQHTNINKKTCQKKSEDRKTRATQIKVKGRSQKCMSK